MYTLQPPGTPASEAFPVDPADVKESPVTYGQTVTGYGAKIPTPVMIRYANRWRRVYVTRYGNAGSAFVVIGGREAYVERY